jgi:hypothetical protein
VDKPEETKVVLNVNNGRLSNDFGDCKLNGSCQQQKNKQMTTTTTTTLLETYMLN